MISEPCLSVDELRCDLTIFATSDLHLQLCPWDYYANTAAPGAGLAAVAGEISRLRGQYPNSLLVDNGDFLQGSALGDAFLATRNLSEQCAHPMIAAMNLAGYDAVALGNHDFDYGIGLLSEALYEARFPALCANLHALPRVAVPFAGWSILQRRLRGSDGQMHPVRIGIFAVTPPQVMIWNEPKLAGRLRATDMIEAAREAITALQRNGADVILALCHSGISGTAAGDLGENVALELAALPGLDALVAGHTHDVFPGPEFAGMAGIDLAQGTLAGRPACMPGYGASHIGLLHLTLAPKRGGGWAVCGGRGEVRALGAARPAPHPSRLTFAQSCDASPDLPEAFAALCRSAHDATVSYLDRSVGQTLSPLSSFFAMIGQCPVTGLVTDAMLWYLRSRLHGAEQEGVTLLAAASPWRAGGRRGPSHYTNLAPGPVLARDVAGFCPFPDELRALRLTGRELRAWLEHSALAFNTIPPGSQDRELLQDNWASYNFDIIRGVTFEIDLSGAGPRIRNLRREGVMVGDEDQFILATTSYRAAGGGNFPATGAKARLVVDTALTIGRIVEDYLTRTGPYRAGTAPAWRLTPVPGARVLFDTCPCAVSELPRPGMEDLGLTDQGFLRLRLDMAQLGALHPA